jgi:hypothetical protein
MNLPPRKGIPCEGESIFIELCWHLYWLGLAVYSSACNLQMATTLKVHNFELELNKSQTEVLQLKRKISKLENQIAEKDKAIESKAKDVM